jgi:hypothetical protein
MPKTQRGLIKTAVILVTIAAGGLGVYFLIQAVIAMHS